MSDSPAYGARLHAEGARFRVWAPKFDQVELLYTSAALGDDADFAAAAAVVPMRREEGVWTCTVPDAGPGTLYKYRTQAGDFPDPASRFQPFGVHGPSQVVDPGAYRWRDQTWQGAAHEDLVFYELHVGAFTPEGTFEAAAQRLPYLRDLGVTAVELMPVADFPGRWNWGYDQAALFAPSRAYGSPDDLRRFIDEAHGHGLAVFLDVIFNHFGPDGAYAPAFGPFFTEKHHTPWGQAVNLDDEGAEHVRAFFLENALHWLEAYHADGLRLDATHALVDDSPQHFLAALTARVAALPGRKRFLIAEDERNLRTVLLPRAEGGYGLDGAWADDFHHQVRNVLAGDRDSYYADFDGTTAADLARTLRQGWFFTGQHSSFLGHARGTDPAGIPLERFVICIQNHDQVGNRAQGNRLTSDVAPDAYRAASALLLFAPETPLLFMGQEWATEQPFQFFTDHNEELGRLVSEGRKKEFEGFSAFGDDVPDPQDPETFMRSKLDWGEREAEGHAGCLALYRDLLKLRRDLDGAVEVTAHGDHALTLRRGRHVLLVALAEDQTLPFPAGAGVVLHTEQPAYAGAGRAPQVRDGRVHFTAPAALVAMR